MNKFNQYIENNLLPYSSKIAANRYLAALRDGFIITMPITIIGSFFLLIACFPIPAVSEALANSGWATYLFKVSGATFDVLAIFVCLGISYSLAKSYKLDGLTVAAISLVSFFILTPNTVTSSTGEVVFGAIPTQWLGSQAIIVSIIVAILATDIFNLVANKWKWTIKMPASVPPAVANSFSALIPGALIIILVWLIYVTIDKLSGGNQFFGSLVFSVVQLPLQNITDSLVGIIASVFAQQFLWFFGLHGSAIMGGITGTIFAANSLTNLALYQAGNLTLEAGARIVTFEFMSFFTNMGGAGATLGLVILMTTGLIKSVRYKKLGVLSVTPGFFNINEPVIFGLPVVLNPVLALPWILIPILNGVIAYCAIYFGIVPPLNGLAIPWTTPVIISGLITCGIAGAILQALLLVLDGYLWYIFIRILDKQAWKEEKAEQSNA